MRYKDWPEFIMKNPEIGAFLHENRDTHEFLEGIAKDIDDRKNITNGALKSVEKFMPAVFSPVKGKKLILPFEFRYNEKKDAVSFYCPKLRLKGRFDQENSPTLTDEIIDHLENHGVAYGVGAGVIKWVSPAGSYIILDEIWTDDLVKYHRERDRALENSVTKAFLLRENEEGGLTTKGYSEVNEIWNGLKSSPKKKGPVAVEEDPISEMLTEDEKEFEEEEAAKKAIERVRQREGRSAFIPRIDVDKITF
jgi:hypothetical protein